MGPIFNEKVAEKWNLWVHEQCTMCIDWLKKGKKSQTLRLLFMNSSRNSPKTHKKKKNWKNANANAFNRIQTYSVYF